MPLPPNHNNNQHSHHPRSTVVSNCLQGGNRCNSQMTWTGTTRQNKMLMEPWDDKLNTKMVMTGQQGGTKTLGWHEWTLGEDNNNDSGTPTQCSMRRRREMGEQWGWWWDDDNNKHGMTTTTTGWWGEGGLMRQAKKKAQETSDNISWAAGMFFSSHFIYFYWQTF